MTKYSPKLLFLFLFFIISGVTSAQYYSMGNDPSYVKWMQIKSKNYTLIYPREIDSLAREYLAMLENKRSAIMEPVMIDPKPICVVLHPYSTISNGSVSWAPKRVDLITSPEPYDGTSEPWIQQLVIHESRHIGQTEHFTKGVYNVLHYIFGEQITGLGVGLYPSSFYLEGDAVIAETELTNAGRGRQAEFLQYSRAAYLNGDYRNWDKLRLGSFKYFTPNKYVFGYLTNSAVRYYSNNYFFSGQYFSYLVKNWYNPRLVFISYKNYAGLKRKEFLDESQIIMTNIWTKDLEKRGVFSTFDTLNTTKKRLYTNYVSGIFINNKTSKYNKAILFTKNGMEHTNTLYYLDTLGKEHPITPFSSNASPFSNLSNGKVYWTESVSHGGSTLSTFSVLRSFDTRSGKIRGYKNNTKYFNPSLSISGDTIAVAEYPVTGSSYLVLLSPDTGKIIGKIEAPRKGQIKETAFIGRDIYCTAILDKGLGLYKFSDGKWDEIIKQQNQSINGLKSFGSSLYFSSDLDGVLNIYLLDTEYNILYRLTNSVYGASSPYIDSSSRHLYYSEYSHLGYNLAKASLDSLCWNISNFSEPYKNPIADMLSTQAHRSSTIRNRDTIDVFNKQSYPAKKYNKFAHLFRFHSWAPVYYNIDRIKSMSYDKFYDLASLGVTLYSQNTLGSAITMLGYSYHKGFHAGHVNFLYKGAIPFIELSADINDRYRDVYDVTRTPNGNNGYYKHPLINKFFFQSSVRLFYEFDFSRTGWINGLIPQVSWAYNNDRYYSYDKGDYITKHELTYGLQFYQVLPIARSQIFPRWGFNLTALGSSAPWTGENFGNLLYLYGYLYLPGITRQQGIKLTGTWQKQFADNKYYYLNSFATLPRGYNKYLLPTDNFGKVTIDYAIPIYLGDVSLGGFLYLKRLQLIPFGEYARDIAKHQSVTNNYYSYGADLLLDFNIFRFNVPLSMGVEYARTGPQTGNRNYFHFLFKLKL